MLSLALSMVENAVIIINIVIIIIIITEAILQDNIHL